MSAIRMNRDQQQNRLLLQRTGNRKDKEMKYILTEDLCCCGGYRTINCHYTAGHGTQTIAQSIANSCNVAMMEMISDWS
ncbi:MAG: hypothetical protein ACLSXO_03890 [Coprococcus sp.]